MTVECTLNNAVSALVRECFRRDPSLNLRNEYGRMRGRLARQVYRVLFCHKRRAGFPERGQAVYICPSGQGNTTANLAQCLDGVIDRVISFEVAAPFYSMVGTPTGGKETVLITFGSMGFVYCPDDKSLVNVRLRV